MKESETREFKKSLAELNAGLVSIAAILNKHGSGELWFGVRSDGNPLIADLLHRIKMVEAWGRGMPLILKNEPNARFHEEAGVFTAAFARPSFLGNDNAETTGKADALLEFISTHRDATIPQMAAVFRMTEDGVNYHLKNLRSAKKLERIGPARGGHWEVLK